MSAMVFPLMKRIMKSMVGNLLWIIRRIERWLEMLDEKEVPSRECSIPNEQEKEQLEETKEEGQRIDAEKRPEPSQITYICPLCDYEMKLKRARKGGWFYGCSQWPNCNGSRNKSDKRPGPVAAVTKLRNSHGEEKWADMEEKKCSGKYKISTKPLLNKCLFCGMDPCDHLGRNCLKRNIYFESQACDHL